MRAKIEANGGKSREYFKEVSAAWRDYVKAKETAVRSFQDLGDVGEEPPSSVPQDDALTAPASGGTDIIETPVKGKRPLQEDGAVNESLSGRAGLSLKKKRRPAAAERQPPKSVEAEQASAEVVLDEKGDDDTKLEVGAGEKGDDNANPKLKVGAAENDDELSMADL